MTYKSKTYNWQNFYGSVTDVIEDMIGLTIVPDNEIGDKPSYPFISFKTENPYSPQYYSRTKTTDAFTVNLSFNCWARHEGEAVSIADDLRTLLHDVKYVNFLKERNIAVGESTDTAVRSSALASFATATNVGFDQQFKLLRRYKSDYPDINKLNHKGSVN